MPYKFAQIILSSKTKTRTASDVYLAEVDPEKELRLGKLFILAEMSSSRGAYRPEDGLKIINFLFSEIPKNYYQNEKYFFRESGLLKIDQILESSLSAANKSFAAFLKEQKMPPAGKNLNLTVGVIHKDFIYFSATGKNRAFLIARSKGKDGVKNKIINILGEDDDPSSGPGKYLFSSIISGPLPRGACALFSNEALPEYFTEKKLANIVSSLAPAGAAELIKNELAGIGRLTSILGLIIKNIKPEKIVSESLLISPPNEPSASLSYLDKTEKQTETFLSPSGLLPFKKLLAKLADKVRIRSKKFLPGNKFVLIGQKIILKKRASRWYPVKSLRDFWILGSRVVWLAGQFFVRAFSPRRLAEFFSAAPGKIYAFFSAIKNWFLRLKLLNKILLAAFAVSIILFSANLAWSLRTKKQALLGQIYSQTYEAIVQKQNQIEASLLYGNEKGARELIIETNNLLLSLSKENEAQLAGFNELKEKYDGQIAKVSHIINIVSPEEVANFSLIRPDARPESLVKAGEKIFSADSASGILYKIDLAGKAATGLGLPDGTGRLSAPSVDKAGNILYRDGGNIRLFNFETETWSLRKINYSGTLGKFSSYNNRLYFLNPPDQITRLTRSGESYGSASGWLKEKTDLSQTVDLGIDGDIYLLEKNGAIRKFSSGRTAELNLEALTSPIQEAAALKISAEEGNYLYILEPAGKRLVVFRKDGSYVAQYQSDKFDNLKDFYIDEKAEAIYFLNAASVYKIKAEHLK